MKGLQNIIYLNGNKTEHSFLAVDSVATLVVDNPGACYERLKAFRKLYAEKYVFGYLSYDLKNERENLHSQNKSWVQEPALYFFVPKHLGKITNGEIQVITGDKRTLEETLLKMSDRNNNNENVQLKSTLTKQEYLHKINSIKNHIQLGDIYEANFCYSFEGQSKRFDTLTFYKELNFHSNAPYSLYGKLGNIEIASASPERFIQKRGNTILSQPIKGTIKRGKTAEEDKQLMQELYSNQKDRSENIMIVDLVRNDLSRIAEPHSVKVDELCKVYTFDTLHQMISTITATVDSKIDPIDIIAHTFPMGSMTGAPKIRAMELIEKYEINKRGLYAGSVGYIAPNNDFDFNVIIRTLLRNTESGHISVSVGGAITALSDPELEYEETLLKADVLLNTLNKAK